MPAPERFSPFTSDMRGVRARTQSLCVDKWRARSRRRGDARPFALALLKAPFSDRPAYFLNGLQWVYQSSSDSTFITGPW